MCIHPIHLPSNNLVFQQQDLFLCHDLYICALDIHMLLWHDLKVFCQALWIFVGSLNVQPNNPSTEPIYTAMNRKPKWLLLVISVYMPTEIGSQCDIHSTPQITALPLFHSPRINFSHWWFNQSSRNINLVSKTQGMPHCSVPVQAIRTGTYFLQNYVLDPFLEFLVNHFTPRKPKVFKPSLESSLIHT